MSPLWRVALPAAASQMRAVPLVLILAAAALAPARAANPVDITKPILTRDGARGCDSREALSRLMAAPADASVEGCLAVEPGTRGYFMDAQGRPPSMIELDIETGFHQRLLWLPANALHNP
jgi:hypothetical protein